MNKQRAAIGTFGLVAAGVTVGVLAVQWLARRSAPQPQLPEQIVSREANLQELDDLDWTDEPTPDSSVVEPAPVSEREVSARPHAQGARTFSADDYEAISADNLGAAFLARATDSQSPDDEAGEADEDLNGFQIASVRELSTSPEDDDKDEDEDEQRQQQPS